VSAGLVSVVIPFLDTERFLEEAVASVLAQSYRPLELILIDGGSSDRSAGIAKRLARRHPQVRVLRMPANRGSSAARNRGLYEATGRFVTFLDSDDVMVKDRLALQVEYLIEHPQTDVVVCGERSVEEPDSPTDLMRQRRSRSDGAHFHIMSMMVRRSALDRVGGFDPSIQAGQDLDWMFRAGRAGLVIGRIDTAVNRPRTPGGHLGPHPAPSRALLNRRRESVNG